MLTYWGEGHLYGAPGNVRDLYRRVFAWLDGELAWTARSAVSADPAS